MGEIALAGAIALIDKLVLVHQNVSHNAVHHDVEVVRKLLSTLKGYLKDTEGRENTEGLKDRIEKVRDLAYETEDAIDKYMYDVPEHIHHHQFTRFLHGVAHPVANRRLSSAMKAIKDKIDTIKATDAFRVCPSDVASSSNAAEIPPDTNPFSRDDDLVGIERRREELCRLILSNESREVDISVFGGAGSGKTTLIHQVYEMVKGNFECHAWIPVPRSCEDLLNEICMKLGLLVHQGMDRREMLSQYLQQRRYILVLDGIWSEDEWNCIKSVLSSNNQGSRIIISTRKRNLASYCASSRDFIYDLNLNPLTWEEAWELFCKKAFPNGKCPRPLVEWSTKIVKRCEGLPHAIVAIGKSLKNNLPSTVTELKKVHDSLEFEPGSLEYIGKLLQSYYHLSSNLKSCFMYFCNFPEDFSVTRGRLIRLWIAEGFIVEKVGQTLEQVADEYLDELVQMSLVHVNKCNFEGRVMSCRVYNLVRGFILSKSKKDNFFTVITKPHTNLDQKHRRLSLHSCSTSTLQGKDFSHVRTFSIFGLDNHLESMARELFSKFKLLKVLDLEDASLEHFPKEVVKLFLLRYLSLRNTKIKSVPQSIKKLQNLMILDLKQTFVTTLPEEIGEIHKLLYLLVSFQDKDKNHAAVGAEVSPGIGHLELLHKLSLIKANNKKGSIVEELGKLTELRKLGITELKKEDGKDLCASIEKMEHLTSLYVKSASIDEYLDLNYVDMFPQMINNLFLGGRLHNIPRWIHSLSGLCKIELKWSKLKNSPLEALGALPSLKELYLHDAYSGEVLEFGAEWFVELRILVIDQCSSLKMVVIQEPAMPKLQKLIIKNCNSLTMVRIAINTVTRLEEMVPQELICFL